MKMDEKMDGKKIGNDEIIETMEGMTPLQLRDLLLSLDGRYGPRTIRRDEEGNPIFPGSGQVVSTEVVEAEEETDTGTRNLFLVSTTGQLTNVLKAIKAILDKRRETLNLPLRRRHDLVKEAKGTEELKGKPQCLIEEINDEEIGDVRKIIEKAEGLGVSLTLHVVSNSTGEVIEVLGGTETKASGTVGIRIKWFDEDFKQSTRDIIQQETGMSGRDVDDLLALVSRGQARVIQVPRHKVEAVKSQLRNMWVGFD